MKNLKTLLVIAAAAATGLAACNSGNMRRNPGRTYAPDMTYSRAYDAYTANPNFSDSQTSRLPVQGTVARGHQLPDHLAEGDTNTYKTFTTSLRFSTTDLTEGKRLFNIYCGICHGTGLDGQGPLYSKGVFAAAPANFKDPKYLHMPVGQMYAAVKYGKNMMGSYASQLDIRQRWMIISYIKKTQSAEAGGDAFALGDSTSSKPANTTAPNTTMALLDSAKTVVAPRSNKKQ